MKILIIPVNFNSYKELDEYLESLEIASQNQNDILIDVCIADNSTEKVQICKDYYINLNLRVYQFSNLGYFGGALSIYNAITNLDKYDYVFISNVDVSYDKSFFSNLKNLEVNKNVGWLAPQIWSNCEGRDRNPKIITRYSYKKIKAIEIMWRFPILHRIYQSTFYKRKRNQEQINISEIYAGHGSFIILTKNFIKVFRKLNYPIFLFGEELFLAELCRIEGLTVEYCPSLKVWDEEHVSTSKMKSKFYYECNHSAIKYIISHFYE